MAKYRLTPYRDRDKGMIESFGEAQVTIEGSFEDASKRAVELLNSNRFFVQVDIIKLGKNVLSAKKIAKVNSNGISKYDNGGGVGVSSVITADNNAIGTGADLNFSDYKFLDKKMAKGSTVKGSGLPKIGSLVDTSGNSGWLLMNMGHSFESKEDAIKYIKEKNSKYLRSDDYDAIVVEEYDVFKVYAREKNYSVPKSYLSKRVYDNGGGVGVSSVITADNNAIGTGADLNFNQYGGGGKISSSDEGTGSQDLKEKAQAKIDKGLTVIHFGYTDYGGTFGDRVAIAYFKKHHPKNILWENSGYNGENAFVFGKVADEYLEETAKYPLGYEDIEDFYYEMQNKQEEKDYKDFVKDLKRTYKVSPNTLSWLMENKSGYYNLEPNMLDFSSEDLTNELVEEGLITIKKMAKGGNTPSEWCYEIGGL